MCSPLSYLYALAPLFILFHSTLAATVDQWRGRSIYQIITDRYALPAGADTTVCDPGKQTWCGGTWNTIRANLDYIQSAGFTAVWISPVSQNYEGPRSSYGDAYHGYWTADATQLNDRFGSSDDLKALSAELHQRGMYLMVDVVVNNVMALSTTPDLSTFTFKEESQYHPYCPIQWGNTTSEQNCWLGDTTVTLPDLNTQDSTVQQTYGTWIQSLVQEYSIDGLRIDAAKHVNIDFWPAFAAKAGVFCMGEVFTSDVNQASEYQGPQALDSVLQYPMYDALTSAFTIPGPQNMSALVDIIAQSKNKFQDPGVLGNFLENQDVPRWHNLSVDAQSLYNAMVFNFMSDGIPIVYYGQEQGFSGNADPWNREPLWPSGYTQTATYDFMTTLNKFRNFLVNSTGNWLTSEMQIVSSNQNTIAILKGDIISVMTNVGSPPQNISLAVYTPWDDNTVITEILSCQGWTVGSNGTLLMSYSKGGVASIFARNADLNGLGMCGFAAADNSDGKHASSLVSSGLRRTPSAAALLIFLFVGFFAGHL